MVLETLKNHLNVTSALFNITKEEITSLKALVENLNKVLSSIKSKLSESEEKSITKGQPTVVQKKQNSARPTQPENSNSIDQKFNVVLYGVNESPSGTSRPSWTKADIIETRTYSDVKAS